MSNRERGFPPLPRARGLVGKKPGVWGQAPVHPQILPKDFVWGRIGKPFWV